jgi:dephospho-CoA kinase
MSAPRPILRVGLTGGIACGKTTVAGFLVELGAFVIDADGIAHELISPDGEAHAEVVARFGGAILDARGRIDRAALGKIVFHDPQARLALNGIVHPKVMAETNRRIEHYVLYGSAPIAVIDAALLVETGMYRKLQRLVVVRCSQEAQIQRLLARGLDSREALARIDAQAPPDEKVAAADYVIDAETTLKETRAQTDSVYASLLADFEKEYGAPGERA